MPTAELIGDVYMIGERIREFDPDLFVVGKPGRYEVWRHYETLFGDDPKLVLVWPMMTLDGRLIHHLRYGDTWSGQVDHLREIEEWEEREQRSFERTIDEIAKDASKRALKALHKDLGLN